MTTLDTKLDVGYVPRNDKQSYGLMSKLKGAFNYLKDTSVYNGAKDLKNSVYGATEKGYSGLLNKVLGTYDEKKFSEN
ncbi:hypothetical protein KY334_05090, partial [Candidatus Woesearchaeota archaeon]|nr:hypothetical protein [Candidatus Woesearchaeota archaeon]